MQYLEKERDDTKNLLVFALSEKNFSRSEEEIKSLEKLYNNYIDIYLSITHNHRFKFLSTDRYKAQVSDDYESQIPDDLWSKAKYLENDTENNKIGLTVIFLVGWSGTEEVTQYFTREGDFMCNYYPDFVVRTGREPSLSDFLTVQISDSELIFQNDIFWPEVKKSHFKRWFEDFYSRERRWGR